MHSSGRTNRRRWGAVSTVVFLGVPGDLTPSRQPAAGSSPAEALAGLRAVCGLLRREHRLLQQLGAGAGDDVRTELTMATLLLAVHADELGRILGLAPGPSLREIAARLDDPWRTDLLAHRAALVAAGSGSTALPPALVDFLL